MFKKFLGIVTALFGGTLSALGFMGAACSVCAPACCTVLIAGPLATLFGAGVALFFHKYNMVFIVVGVLISLSGLVLMIRKYRIKARSSKC